MVRKHKTRLEQSILHWETQLANAKSGALMDITADHCPLCEYYYMGGPERCTNEKYETCPVALKTSKTDCDGSPWEDVHYSLVTDTRIAGPGTAQAVEAELAFLRSLADPESRVAS